MRTLVKKLIHSLGLEGIRSRKAVLQDIRRVDPTATLNGKNIESQGLSFDPIAEPYILYSLPMIAELQTHCGFSFVKQGDKLKVTAQGIQLTVQSAIEVGIIYDVFGRNVYRLVTEKPLTIIDIGANIGIASIYFAKELNAKVHAFELVPSVAARAQAHVFDCGLSDRVTVYPVGLGKDSITLDVPFSEELTGNTSLHWEVENRPTTQSVTCQVESVKDTLGPILSAASTPIFMKLDCEGAEYEILAAMKAEGQLAKIDGFLMEYHNISPDENRTWIENLLKSQGFNCVSLRKPSNNHDMIYAFRNA